MMMPTLSEEEPAPLEEEAKMIENAKKIFLMTAGLAVEKYQMEPGEGAGDSAGCGGYRH